MEPKFPDITVELVGQDGNGFAIVGRIRVAMRRAQVNEKEIIQFTNEAMSGDYDHLLQVAMEWVTVT